MILKADITLCDVNNTVCSQYDVIMGDNMCDKFVLVLPILKMYLYLK